MVARSLRLLGSGALGLLACAAALSSLAQSSRPAAPPAGAVDDLSVQLERLMQAARKADANDPAGAIAPAREALALAERSPRRSDMLRARAQLSESLRRNSAYAEARQVVDAGLALPIGADPAERAARAALVFESGQIFWNRSDYVAAEARYLEAQKAAEALDDRRLLIRVLNSRGIVARHQKLFAESEQHFHAALNLAEQNDEAELRLQIRNNLAILLYDQKRFDEARPLLLENLRVHTAAQNRRSMANALINLGSLENTAERPAAALPHFEQALALRLELGVPRHVASARINVGSTLARLGRGDDALVQLAAATPVAEKLGAHELLANLHSALAEAHAARGDYRAALEAQRRAERESDLVASERTATSIAELRERFETEKRQREIVELRAAQQKMDTELRLAESELQRTRVEHYAIGSGLLLGLATTLALVSRQRAIARAERRARDAAEEANALKSKLLDLAAHDLKTPLVGTMLTAAGIADDAADRPEIAEQARALHAESERMFHLVQSLLDSSAAETGRLTLQRAKLDLHALAGESVAALSARAQRKQQRIALASPTGGTAAHVLADAARLRQVIDNLVDNALKFSPSGSSVAITVAHDAGRVRLSVRDQGPGLTPADRARLFQPFQRLSATPTAGESSTGLGLALARDLVAAHGGEIRVESEPGAGATFIVELPAD